MWLLWPCPILCPSRKLAPQSPLPPKVENGERVTSYINPRHPLLGSSRRNQERQIQPLSERKYRYPTWCNHFSRRPGIRPPRPLSAWFQATSEEIEQHVRKTKARGYFRVEERNVFDFLELCDLDNSARQARREKER